MKSNIKNFCCALKRIKWKKYLSIILCVIILNTLISVTTGFNIIKSGTKKVLDSLGIYTEQVKEVVIKSDGYDESVPGSWKITKKAEWTDYNKVKVTMDLDTVVQSDNRDKDVVFVLNALGERETSIADIKNSLADLTTYLLRNGNNKFAFIKSDDSIVDFTNDSTTINEIIENTYVKNYSRNYTLSIVNLSKLLKNYIQDENRDLVILFLTDGAPSTDTPNQIAEYEILKDKYPFMIMNGIQYEKGTNVIKELKEISDRQYTATSTTIKDILYEVALSPEKYEKLEINDFLDTTYYEVDTNKDVLTTTGTSNLDIENQIINWDLGSDFLTGRKASITINLTLKDPHSKNKGFYPTNKKTEIKSQLKEQTEKSKTSNDTNVLKNYYNVTYDTNPPSDCDIKQTKTDTMIIYNNIAKRNDSLMCSGYLFKGWELEKDTITQPNADSFIMPVEDVIIRGVWTKVSISKSMDGEIYQKTTLWNRVKNDAERNKNGAKTFEGTESDEYPIYYYHAEQLYDRTEKKYYTVPTNVDNNIIFGGFCWQIVRTTETGGTKLIYNGKPSEIGSCENSGDNQTIGKSKFNQENQGASYNSIAKVGYMYNKDNTRYNVSKKSANYVGLLSYDNFSGTNYYYANSFSYDEGTKKYTLSSPFDVKVEYNIENTEIDGKYTCKSTSSIGTCDKLIYIVGKYNGYSYGGNQKKYLTLEKGETLTEANSEIVLGEKYSFDNNNYTLTGNIKKIKKLDLTENYEEYQKMYKNYYVCTDLESENCTSLNYLNVIKENFVYIMGIKEDYLFGNSFSFDGKKYRLENTKHAKEWNWDQNSSAYDENNPEDFYNKVTTNNLKNYHYTCFTTENECEEIYYVFYIDGSSIEYNAIKLINGENIATALNKMLWADDVNKDSSIIKMFIDEWYVNNLEEYESYIEDTIFCNDREIENIAGWQENGNTHDYLTFNRNVKNLKLECSNKTDQFTVRAENGNGALTYPIGLLTAKELELLGNGIRKIGDSYSDNYFSMTPELYLNYAAFIYNQNVDSEFSYEEIGVRPSISLNHNIEYVSGYGSKEKPYIINANPNQIQIEEAVIDSKESKYVKSSNGIDFSAVSSIENGRGLYIRSGTENDVNPIYYYRGSVNYNNVLFADHCWKIVRTTEDGGKKLIYNGKPNENNQCPNQTGENTQIKTGAFNNKMSGVSNSVSYTYKTDDNNDNDSVIKKEIDTWYEENLLSYTNMLEDSVWCNDKSTDNESGYIYYGGYNRLVNSKSTIPALKNTEACPQKEDRYTVSELADGNGKLKYPIGLLTADEANVAGIVYNQKNTSSYLYTNQNYWTMTPYQTYMRLEWNSITQKYNIPNFSMYDAAILGIYNDSDNRKGSLSTFAVQYFNPVGIRPTITLKSGINFASGDGTANNPYVVEKQNIVNDKVYSITVQGNSEFSVDKSSAKKWEKVTLKYNGSKNIILKSFKANGILIEGDSFKIAEENVVITDIKYIEIEDDYIIESEHNPYPNNLNTTTDGIQGKVYGEKTFEGAKYLTVSLDIQTESTQYDWVYLYDSPTSTNPVNGNRYGGTTRRTETITISGNYVKLVFKTDSSGNNYYGFKATITPHYD